MSSLLLTGPTWYAVDGTSQRGDVLLTDGVVAQVGTVDAPPDAERVDADGLVLLPGFVDLHTHLREPGREDAETIASGSRAAAVGGYTAVLAMANTTPVTDTAEAAERILDLGRAAGLVDVVPVGAVTKGLEGVELAELGLMHRSRAGVRVFSDDGHCVADGRVMRRALEYVRAFGGVVSQHSQDPSLAGPQACCHEGEVSGRLGLPGWPPVAEASIIARDAMLAEHTRSRVHVAHVSTAEGLDVVRWAKARGIRMTAEVTPHHLALGTDLLTGYDPVYKVNPPLRPDEDRAGARRRAARRHHRRGRHRPRPARAARQGARVRRRGVRHARPRDGLRRRPRPARRRRAARLGRPRPASCRSGRPRSPASPSTAARSPPASPPTSCSSTPPPRSPSTATPRSPCPATPRGTAGTLTGAVHTTILRGTVSARGGEPTAC